MVITTKVTYKYLMNKNKDFLCNWIIDLGKYQSTDYRKLMQLNKYELSSIIMKLLDNT